MSLTTHPVTQDFVLITPNRWKGKPTYSFHVMLQVIFDSIPQHGNVALTRPLLSLPVNWPLLCSQHRAAAETGFNIVWFHAGL